MAGIGLLPLYLSPLCFSESFGSALICFDFRHYNTFPCPYPVSEADCQFGFLESRGLMIIYGEAASGLGCEQHDHVSAFHPGLIFDDAYVLNLGDDSVQQRFPH